ncbi:type I-B CRISPR-associated protein Cas5b [Clostridium algidicarnis]|uniref:CRISPR-associated protein Cas5h n=2 Tax=Clostridium algidicarnis TaxID=37659 RepID=A0A2S6FWV3_9CLOT|nr:type I-B CRISPR-associated protein Cas5b [Clostridium algidicarnis]MBB6632274.1 type I-B CRISPR-associated protein Cas5 [Clostridium algidicarnis]MBU3219613.1 type I-B CRISPR-associated protein Cas5b [Clostridium algidicarnis]MCB2287580.1 type I-B CRISPR-associated protein Cas5b [Clostridium algidicarnis]PPK48079.1 CRISPR-associated protein Cas5h [Clostridium algidicarnis DSM 15099]
MKALKFTLSGRTAFFKKPDVNSYYYFTYGNIHKVALLGILGATLGLDGYINQNKSKYPKFYEELKDLKISIVPKNINGYIPKKIQIFNNSVGYASKEQGGNLIVKEQWLENPKWDIYISLESSKFSNEIESRFKNQKFVYIPYLGKNDHYADITNIEILNLNQINSPKNIDSLFIKSFFNILPEEMLLFDEPTEDTYKYEEQLPIGLEEVSNQYVTEKFIHTNLNVNLIKDYKLYEREGKVLFFF